MVLTRSISPVSWGKHKVWEQKYFPTRLQWKVQEVNDIHVGGRKLFSESRLDARHNARFFHITSFDLHSNLRDGYHYAHFNNKKQGSEHCTFPEIILFTSIDSYSQVMLAVDSKVCVCDSYQSLTPEAASLGVGTTSHLFIEQLQYRHSGRYKTKCDPGSATEKLRTDGKTTA